jgi:hypothetical protein
MSCSPEAILDLLSDGRKGGVNLTSYMHLPSTTGDGRPMQPSILRGQRREATKTAGRFSLHHPALTPSQALSLPPAPQVPSARQSPPPGRSSPRSHWSIHLRRSHDPPSRRSPFLRACSRGNGLMPENAAGLGKCRGLAFLAVFSPLPGTRRQPAGSPEKPGFCIYHRGSPHGDSVRPQPPRA